MLPDVIGRVVVSRAGRDKARSFVVVAVEDDAHVRIADGETHKAAKAKRKKLKHLHFTPYRVDEGELRLHSERGVADAYLRTSLKRAVENNGISKEE